jgi:hypothetical protein
MEIAAAAGAPLRRQAVQAEQAALNEYMKILRIVTELVAHGKAPERVKCRICGIEAEFFQNGLGVCEKCGAASGVERSGAAGGAL